MKNKCIRTPDTRIMIAAQIARWCCSNLLSYSAP